MKALNVNNMYYKQYINKYYIFSSSKISFCVSHFNQNHRELSADLSLVSVIKNQSMAI